jgi:2,4-dienoyl-CoA reductase-like NADH-dependent reductase (Old Yellow Enzyme family)
MEAVADRSSLFQAIRLNTVEIKNRIVMSAMAVGDGSPAGHVTEQTKAFYTARAKGGVGLIVLGGCVSTQRAWDEAPFNGVYRTDVKEAVSALRELVDAVHAHGAKIFVEPMTSFGRLGSSKKSGLEPVAPSAIRLTIPEGAFPDIMTVPGGRTMEMPREISIPEIVALEDEVAQSATIALEAGFDGIELAAHMSYLVTSFLSPRSNKRTDVYGGSLENRLRFLLNIVTKTRTIVGPDYPVGVKLICNEHVDGGLTISDTVEIGQALERAGVDYLSLSEGCYETLKMSTPTEDGALLKHGEPQAFKKTLGIPIVVPSVHDPDLAAETIAVGNADMIAFGRPLLADPAWASKTLDGRVNEIVRCDHDNYCILRLMSGMRVHCKLNPAMGRESGAPDVPLARRVREGLVLFGATKPRLVRLSSRLGIGT